MIDNFQLYESINSDEYINIISEKKALKLLSKIDIPKNNQFPIYRRVSNDFENEYDLFNIVNPKTITRYSRYANNNLYNILLSNLPSWKGFPKRNKSLSCGNYKRAYEQGTDELMMVFPLKPKAKIAWCDEDIWKFCKNFKTESDECLDDDGYDIKPDLDEFNKKLYSFISWINRNHKIAHNIHYDNNWISLLTQLKNIDKYSTKEERSDADFLEILNMNIIDFEGKDWIEGKISTLKFLDSILNPNDNNVCLSTYDKHFNYDLDMNEIEFWTESVSLLISVKNSSKEFWKKFDNLVK